MTLTTEETDSSVNVFHDGEMIVSVSEEYMDIAIYEKDNEEPVGVYDIE